MQMTHFHGSKKMYDLTADWSGLSISKHANEGRAA